MSHNTIRLELYCVTMLIFKIIFFLLLRVVVIICLKTGFPMHVADNFLWLYSPDYRPSKVTT